MKKLMSLKESLHIFTKQFESIKKNDCSQKHRWLFSLQQIYIYMLTIQRFANEWLSLIKKSMYRCLFPHKRLTLSPRERTPRNAHVLPPPLPVHIWPSTSKTPCTAKNGKRHAAQSKPSTTRDTLPSWLRPPPTKQRLTVLHCFIHNHHASIHSINLIIYSHCACKIMPEVSLVKIFRIFPNLATFQRLELSLYWK